MYDITFYFLQNLNKNQYVRLDIDNGRIVGVEICNRLLGFLSLGISTFFTQPYVLIKITDQNEDTNLLVEKIKKYCDLNNYPFYFI